MDKGGNSGRRYSAGEKAAAVGMVRALRGELGTGRGTAQRLTWQLVYSVCLYGGGFRGPGGRTLTMARNRVCRLVLLLRINGLNRKCVS